MLSCNIGKNSINTIEYSDSKLREYSNKGVLKCPLCEGKMIYRNGNYKIAHFSHEQSCSEEQNLAYSHPETCEHVNGKKVIYEWLKNQSGVDNLKLEAWIPETKQRPDIYFEMNDKRYVIEYQCSPIATKYDDRHELYRLADIFDIWILGVENYSVEKDIDTNQMQRETKTIERQLMQRMEFPLMYLYDNQIILTSTTKREKITEVVKFITPYKNFNINEITLSDLFNINAYESVKYKYDKNKVNDAILKIKHELIKCGMTNVNIEDNKIYTFYGNIRKMIHVCWDTSEILKRKNGFDYIPIVISDEFGDFYLNKSLCKNDIPIKTNYMYKNGFYIFNEDKYYGDLLREFDILKLNTREYKGKNSFKNYDIRLVDSFYKEFKKVKNIGTHYSINSTIDRELSLYLKLNKTNYISVNSSNGNRLTPSDMYMIKSTLSRYGYNNIEIYWG